MYKEDLTNRKVGHLTVIKLSNKRTKNRDRHWVCLCDCGRTKIVRQYLLKTEITKSCGCLVSQVGNRSPHWRGHGEISLSVWSKLKRDARKRKLSFDLKMEEVWDLFLKQNRMCVYTGLPLGFPKTTSSYDGTASLDRIDSSKGYTLDNVQWVHKAVNIMKQDMSNEEFFEFCKLICIKNRLLVVKYENESNICT